MQIVVAGGTGWIGTLVVQAVQARGHVPVVLARSTGADLVSGVGLEQAVAGSSVVIDVSNVTTLSRRSSVAFFATASERLLDAGRRAGVGHHVALSIVGVDRVDSGYYAGKRRQEELVLAGPVPASVLRATQFYEFAAQVLERGRGPLIPVPRMLSQPIAAREVAGALLDLALGPAVGLAPELAGPDQHDLPDLVRQLLRRRGEHRLVVPVRMPGAAGRAMASGGLLPTGPGPRGTQPFAEWISTQGRV